MGRSYKDLVAWQKAMDLVTATYRSTTTFPKEEQFGLTSQLRRAAVSIPSNIAEGQGRLSEKEFRHFLGLARGSLMEVETQFQIAQNLAPFLFWDIFSWPRSRSLLFRFVWSGCLRFRCHLRVLATLSSTKCWQRLTNSRPTSISKWRRPRSTGLFSCSN